MSSVVSSVIPLASDAPEDRIRYPSMVQPISDWRMFDTIPAAAIEQLRERYANADPFPHLIVDELLSRNLLDGVETDFEVMRAEEWQTYTHALQTKQTTRTNAPMPPSVQAYFDGLYSGPFLRFLTKVTGIQNLISDPTLFGGGMHQIGTGGRFDVHIDFQKHPDNDLYNRMVVITYLNRDWRLAYGGQLELWRQDPVERAASVVPAFGRTVILEHSRRSTHGHPQPVAHPRGRARRSVAAYFYSNGREDGLGASNRSTAYAKRAGRTPAQRLELTAQQVLPPIVLTGLKALKAKLRR